MSDFVPYHRPTSRIQCFIFLVVLFILIVVIMIILAVILLQPKAPKLGINAVEVSPFVVSNSKITATWHISFYITYPKERMSITYRNVQGFVYYKDTLLSSINFSTPIFHPKSYQESVKIDITAVSFYVQEDVGKAIVGDLAHEVVTFSFKVRARVSFRFAFLVKKRWLMAACDNVVIRFSGTESAMMDGEVSCTVDL